MTTTSTLILLCALGQVGDVSNFGATQPGAQPPLTQPPVPQSSARRSIDTPAAMPSSRFGAPTPAEPSVVDNPNTAQPRSLLTQPQAGDLEISDQNRSNPSASFQPLGQGNTSVNAEGSTEFQPAMSQELSAPTQETAAKRLIGDAFPTSDDVGDDVQQLALVDVVAAIPDRTRRAAAIRTYWEAATLVADWQFASQEYELMQQVSAANNPAQNAVLSAAKAASQARLIEAQMAANSAQFALGELVPGMRSETGAPLPIDTPLSGKYNTHFETLFSARVPPPGLRRIHETLPLRQDLVEARAAAVFAASDSVDQQIQAYQSGRASLTELLREFENLRTQRGAFLGALRDYNLEIAEYALGTSQPNDPPDKVVGMMIKSARLMTPVQHNVPSQPTQLQAVGAQGTGGSVMVVPAGANVPPSQPPSQPFSQPFSQPLQPSAPSQFVPAQGGATQLPAPQNVPLQPNSALLLPGRMTPVPPSQPQVSGPSSAQTPRLADQSSAAATAPSRPSTERVLGTLRDVTGETPTEQFQPSSAFGASIGNAPPEPPTTSVPPTGGSRFGASISSETQPVGAQINSATIGTPSKTSPALPPLTP